MIKTEMQIERDFYAFVKDSNLAREINGDVYRSEMRPYDSESEDLVIKFLAGIDGQIQTGVVILNLYVPDVTLSDGRKVADKARIAELQSLILEMVIENEDTEYLLETDGTITSMLNEEINQHLINARIKFQRITE